MRALRRIETGLVVSGLAAVAFAIACGSSKSPPACNGDLRCDCYPNHTCNAGLVCLSNLCVAPESGGGGGAVVGSGGLTTVLTGAGGSVSTGGPEMGGATIPPASTGGTVIPPVSTGGSTTMGGRNDGGSIAPTGGVSSTGSTASTAGGSTGVDGGAASPYITQSDGWASDPAHQVQGALYTYADDGGSNVYPECKSGTGVGTTCFKGTPTSTQFCASGTVAQALTATGVNCQLISDSCDWSSYWGAALAVNLNQSPDAADGAAWNGSAYTGVSFDITINAMASNLRLYINLVDGTQYCYAISASKTYTLAWSQFRRDCYTTGGAALSGAQLAQIKSFAWQAGTDATMAHAFDFCVDRVKIN